MKEFIKEWILPPSIFIFIQTALHKARKFKKYKKIDFSKNKAIKNIHYKDRCFILGLGKSINEQDLTLLKNEIVIGISSLFNHKDLKNIQPNYYVLSPVVRNHPKNNKEDLINWLHAMDKALDDNVIMFIYIGDKKYIDENNIFKSKKIYWVNYDDPWNGKDIEDINLDAIPGIQGVVEVALSVAMYLGFKETYMLGFDLSWYEGVYHYFDDKAVYQHFGGKTQYDMKKVYNMDSEWCMRVHAEIFKKFKALYKIKKNIFNANANQDTYVDTFPKVDYSDLFKKEK